MYTAFGNMQLKVLTVTFDLLLSKLSSESRYYERKHCSITKWRFCRGDMMLTCIPRNNPDPQKRSY